jgi:DnaK suppressor protein
MEVQALDDALERIERGIYGICVSCGSKIDPARLAAVPLTPHCLRCQQRSEGSAV